MQTLITPERNIKQRASLWDEIYDAQDRNTVLTARVVAVKNQATLAGAAWELSFEQFPHIRGLVPYTETGLPMERIMNLFVDEEIHVRIKGIDKANNIVAATRRELVEEAYRQLLRKAEQGITFEAPVIFATNTRLGVDIGGGVIKIFSRSNTPVFSAHKPNELYEVNQAVKVIVTAVDKEHGELAVALVDPWANEHLQYLRGDIVIGKVVRLAQTYLLIAVQPGITGLLPYPVNAPAPALGQEIKCKVTKFELTEKDLRLAVFDPETIAGRQKNRNYWLRRRRLEQEKTPNRVRLTVLDPEIPEAEPAAEAAVMENDAL